MPQEEALNSIKSINRTHEKLRRLFLALALKMKKLSNMLVENDY